MPVRCASKVTQGGIYSGGGWYRRRMEPDGIEAIYVDSEGKEWPGWALRAGFTITRTDYDHGRRRIKLWLSEEKVPEPGVAHIRRPA